MKYIATVSFSSKDISLYEGQEVDLDPSLVSDYVKCGYLLKVEKKGGVKNEGKRDKR